MQKSRKKKEKKKQKNRTWMVIVLIMVYLGGLFVYAIPDLQKVALQKENEKAVAHFQEAVEDSQQDRSGEQTDSTSATSNQIPKNAQLYQEMQAYNQQIFSNGQSGLTDPWAYEQETLEMCIRDRSCTRRAVSITFYWGARCPQSRLSLIHIWQIAARRLRLPSAGSLTMAIDKEERVWKRNVNRRCV